MSNPNEEPKSSNNIDIDETGKVVINDPELANTLEELSEEELEELAGGLKASPDDVVINIGC